MRRTGPRMRQARNSNPVPPEQTPQVREVVAFEALPIEASGSRRAIVEWSDGSVGEAARWYHDEILISEGRSRREDCRRDHAPRLVATGITYRASDRSAVLAPGVEAPPHTLDGGISAFGEPGGGSLIEL